MSSEPHSIISRHTARLTIKTMPVLDAKARRLQHHKVIPSVTTTSAGSRKEHQTALAVLVS